MKRKDSLIISVLIISSFILLGKTVFGINLSGGIRKTPKRHFTRYQKNSTDSTNLSNPSLGGCYPESENDPEIMDLNGGLGSVTPDLRDAFGVVVALASASANPSDRWEDIKSKLREAARYIKENEILDATAKSLLSEIPFAGGVVAAYWENLDVGQEKKAQEVAKFLERLSNQQEKRFETILAYLDSQKKELEEGKESLNGLLDDVSKLLEIAERIERTGNATYENTGELKRMVALLTIEVEKISKQLGISTASEALDARVSLSESDRMRINRNEKVYEAVEREITIDPDYSHQMGILAVFEHRYSDAERYFKEALSVDANYADAYVGLALLYQLQANYTLRSGDFAAVEGLLRQAGMNIDKALKLDHVDIKALVQSGYVFKEYGQMYILKGQADKAATPLSKAKQRFELVLEKDPQNSGALNGLGNVYFLQNDLDTAIIYYQRAIQIAPDYLYAHHDLAWAYFKRGRNDVSVRKESYQKAIDEFQKVLELNDHQHILREREVNEFEHMVMTLRSQL